MTVNVSQAAAAYARAAAQTANIGGAAEAGVTGESFGDVMASAMSDTIQATRHSEHVGMQAVANQAELSDIVTAVNNAEMTLQTVVAIRDRVIQAYQEILRMPI
jgi:flagellar hook-basal body complex protein FliE